MSLRSVLPLFLCLVTLTGCGSKELTLSSFDGLKKVTVTVEVADTPKERDLGLMNRTKLEAGKGMLFVFKEPAMLSFWMKNTLIPLEILYFDASGEFVSTAEMTPCTADPCAQYKTQAMSQYALEVNPDFRKANEIGVGWKLDLNQVRKMARPK